MHCFLHVNDFVLRAKVAPFARVRRIFALLTHLFVRTGRLLNDDISLAAAGYAEQECIFLVVSKPSAPAVAPVPVADATSEQPRVVSHSTESNVSAAAQKAHAFPVSIAAVYNQKSVMTMTDLKPALEVPSTEVHDATLAAS